MKESLVKRIGFSNIIIVLMQLCMYPYLFFYFWGLPDTNIVAVVFFVIISCLCLRNKKKAHIPFVIVIMMAIQSFVWLIYFLYYNDTSYLVRIFLILLSYLSLLLLSKDASIILFSKVYCKIIAIQGILGIIAFILIYVDIISPISSISFNDYGDLYEFYGLTFVKVHIGNFARINGFFDEPGAFAFWGMFALLFNKLVFDNKKIELVIIFSLLFTFSSAYFILLPLYFLWFYGNHLKNLLLVILLFIPISIIVVNFVSDNEGFLKYTVERFEGGQIHSTRYEQAELTKKIFESSPVLGIGAKKLDDRFGTKSSDNPYEILAKDGVVGLIFTYLPLFYIAFVYARKKAVLGPIIILSLNYLQRPFHINEMHYFILYLFCMLVILKYGRSNVREHSPLLMGENVSPLQTKHINS